MAGRKAESRLKKDLVIWFVTAAADRQPHATLVWFLWQGDSFVVYSQDGQKVRDVQANPKVALHLSSDPVGTDMVRATGTAKVVSSKAPAQILPAYRRKYRQELEDMGYTWEQFAGQYHNEIRVEPVTLL